MMETQSVAVSDSPLTLNLADLPMMPLVATRIYQMLEDEDVDIPALTKAVQADPAVVARVVKMANSSYYGSRRGIKTLPDAITTIGLTALRGTVLQAAMQKLYQPFGPAELMLWQHANAVAYGAKFLASRIRPTLADEAFLAGLLHDIGMLVLNWTAPERFSLLLTREEVNPDADFAAEEYEVFKVNHAEVGGKILRKWGFPKDLITVATHHHDFSGLLSDRFDLQSSTVNLTALVSLADLLCLKLGLGYQRYVTAEWEKLPQISILEVNALFFDKLVDEFQAQSEDEWQDTLSMPTS